MTGYCQDCRKIVEMTNVQTIQLANLRFVHSGACIACTGKMWKSINEKDILVEPNGHHYPRIVYAGKNTPDKIMQTQVGQTIVRKGVEIQIEKKKDVRPLDVVKEEIKKNVKKTR